MPTVTLSPIRSAGFTLVELITVMVLLGILAAVALPRIDFDSFAQRTYARELSLALRHAQKVAIAARCPVEVSVSTSGYSAAYAGGACGHGSLAHPSRGSQLAGSGTASSGGSITFDGWGRSANGLTILLPGGRSIVVHPGSGYVED